MSAGRDETVPNEGGVYCLAHGSLLMSSCFTRRPRAITTGAQTASPPQDQTQCFCRGVKKNCIFLELTRDLIKVMKLTI